jgi:hypothetical protein
MDRVEIEANLRFNVKLARVYEHRVEGYSRSLKELYEFSLRSILHDLVYTLFMRRQANELEIERARAEHDLKLVQDASLAWGIALEKETQRADTAVELIRQLQRPVAGTATLAGKEC